MRESHPLPKAGDLRTLKREAAIVLALAVVLAVLFARAPIAQFGHYHNLADTRAFFGVPHFWNVVSNVPFLIIGLMGLELLQRRPMEASRAWATLFGGTALVCFGSIYYHLDPNDATLVWDRLPIGLAFAGFLTALMVEHARGNAKRLAQRALLPLIGLSVGSVYWWRVTGDLSLWVWVQLAPMLGAALAVALLAGQYTHRRHFMYALGCYGVAKVFELGDRQFLEWTGGILSGHSLKHLAAAAGVAWLYAMLAKRRPLSL